MSNTDAVIEKVARAMQDTGLILGHADEVAKAALDALEAGNWWGPPGLDRRFVMSNRQVMHLKNKSGCVCCIDEDAGDELLSRCDLHQADCST